MTERVECILEALDSVNCEHSVCAYCVAHQYCDGFLDYAAANVIKSLCAELEQTKHERDAAIADMKDIADNYVVCMHCKKRDEESGACDKWYDQDGCWQWRGAQKEE